ncbi:serine hydrolase [Gracilimonas tropica]|uniref:serine hydrolase n=1 Tax=Gracilimonas tropica TaxID=454600 RepID=UPI00035CBEE7|nr:serine hydrolase [Gracilimonas tropica]
MKYLYLLLILIFGTACTTTDHPETITELEQAIESRLSGLEGTFGIAFKNLNNPDEYVFINEDERFHAASTMKTPVIVELYKRAESGEFDVQDSIVVKNTFKSIVDGSEFTMQVSEDSEQGLYEKLNAKTSLYDLAYQMITRSSNLATNILIDFLGAESVTQTMRSIGADSIEVLRGVEDIKAYEAGLSNTTTPRDLLVLFEEIEQGALLNDRSKEAIISILKDQKYNEMIPAKLPAEASVAHKTGWITNVHHDSGIVYMPDGRAFVLIFLSKEAPNREAVLDAAADIASYCYQFMLSNK